MDDGVQASNLVKWPARHVTEQLVGEGAAVGSGGPNMTLQGQAGTMPGGRPSLYSVYVALSRVRGGSHFCIWDAPDEKLMYLTTLTHSPGVLEWFAGYNDDGMWAW